MAQTKFLKCTCASCGGHIEFPADGIGMTIPCPHCGSHTELMLESPEVASQRSSRSVKWAIAGVVILLVGVAGTLGALGLARKLLKNPPTITGGDQRSRRKPNASVARTEPMLLTNDFSVSNVTIEKTPGSTLMYAVGTAKNQSDRQRFNVTVELDLLDSAGMKVGTAKDYRSSVDAHGEWTFRALLLKGNVASARVTSIAEKE
jgi:hypothetical protein